MALVVGTMSLSGAIVWLADKRWPGKAPPPWDPELDKPPPLKDGIDTR